MRHSPTFALFLLAACSAPVGGNQAGEAPAVPGPAATVTVLSDDGKDCLLRWQGKPVSLDGVLDNSVKLISGAIEKVGGIERITEETLPSLRLEAAGGVPYACTGPAMRQMQRAGLGHVMLAPAGGTAREQRADFPFDPDGPSQSHAILRLETGGGMSWDGAAIDRAGLAERARAARSMAPRIDLIVAPQPDSDFATLLAALGAIEQERLDSLLAGCAGSDGPVFDTRAPC